MSPNLHTELSVTPQGNWQILQVKILKSFESTYANDKTRAWGTSSSKALKHMFI